MTEEPRSSVTIGLARTAEGTYIAADAGTIAAGAADGGQVLLEPVPFKPDSEIEMTADGSQVTLRYMNQQGELVEVTPEPWAGMELSPPGEPMPFTRKDLANDKS